VSLEQAVSREAIDYETLLLLFGMMVVVGYLRLAGFFGVLTNWAVAHVRSPLILLAVTVMLSGLLSTFLVNDIVCVALTPLVLHLTRRFRLNPIPYLVGLATAANIGSAGTITGNPQNMMIGVQSHIPYWEFAAKLMPVAVLGLLVDCLLVMLLYRGRLLAEQTATDAEAKAPTPAAEADEFNDARPHPWLLTKSVAITLGALVLFFAGLPIALVALGAAAALLLGRVRPEKVYRQIDWSLLVMFTGLFVVVYAFRLHVVAGWHLDQWGMAASHPVGILSLLSVGLSNLVSNVPAVMLLEPVVQGMAPERQETAWLVLAMSSTFAGNLTLLGSVANLIVVENARRAGIVVSFWEYCKVGVPVTVLTLLIGVLWLALVPY
jgi:Na+/H+ antiporter NhaD/arsenite permease-like protein